MYIMSTQLPIGFRNIIKINLAYAAFQLESIATRRLDLMDSSGKYSTGPA
jgi:hypothetical protein